MPPYLPNIQPSVLDQTEIGSTNNPNDANLSESQPFQLSTNGTGIHPSDLPSPEVDHSEIERFEPLMQIIDKIADGQRVPPQVTMRYEMLRFCTLRSFPKENKPYITRLAQAGFYYANTGDEVVCYCCGLRKEKWREDDRPMEIHRQLNPNCSFLLRNSEVNVPIMTSSSSDFLQLLQQNLTPSENTDTSDTALQNSSEMTTVGINLTGRQTSENANHHNREEATSNHSKESSQTQTLNANAGTDTRIMPRHPHYATKSERHRSFNECSHIVIPPQSLADAGFFYAGVGDCVRCFHCGVGLRHWSEEDEPWIEHSRWSKDCSYVKAMKGQEFVNLVQMAVQCSQNQNEGKQCTSDNLRGSNPESHGGENTENMLNMDAARSVLEMGYHPNLVLTAICALSESEDHQNITATILMEKIFEFEDSESASESEASISSAVISVTHRMQTHNTEEQISQTTPDMQDIEDIELSQETLDLLRENRHLKERNFCLHCKAVPRDMVFLSCPFPHLALCHNCFVYFDRCPLCDTAVKAFYTVRR